MFDWIGNLFLRGYSGIRDLVGDIRGAIANVVGTFVAVFTAWVAAGIDLVQAASFLYGGLRKILGTLWNLGRRIAFSYIPNAVTGALNAAVAWTERRYADAVALIQRLVAEATALAQQLYGDLRSWATGLFTTAFTYIHDIINLLNAVAARVFALLMDPRALADWVAGAIIGAVWRWVSGNAETLTRLALARAVSSTVSLASLLEQIIVDVFM